MAALVYNKKQLCERIERYLNSNFPGEDWKTSRNEMLLHIDEFIPFVMKAQMFEGVKIDGVFQVPDAYLVTYNYTISSQNTSTKEWYVTLAQPPLALPTGYDITQCYVANPTDGKSRNGLAISNKRAAFRRNLPASPGFQYRIENSNKLYMRMWDGSSMYGFSLFVQLPISRTDDITAELNMPDDAINAIFDKVVQRMVGEMQIPQDTVKDGLQQGNKGS